VAVPLRRLEGKYQILEKFKEGGMGAIYRVRHRLLGDERVVKILRPQLEDDPGLRLRFEREARNASRLSHPNIAQLHDFTIDEEGVAYIVMEYIRGWTLEEILASRGQLPLGLVVLKAGVDRPGSEIVAELVRQVREQIGPVAAFKTAVIVDRLPKTRSGKILRGTMKKIADSEV